LQILMDLSPLSLNPGVLDQGQAAQLYNAEQGYRSCVANLRMLAEGVNPETDAAVIFQDN